MKVLFYAYPWAMQSPGGGEIMLLKTKAALEKEGVNVKLFNQWEDKLSNYDILHVFGGVKDCLGLMLAAKDIGVKVALSPIFWSTFQRAFFEDGNPRKKTAMVLRHLTKVALPSMPSARRKMCLCADLLLPNSNLEAKQVSRLFSINRKKMQVIPLGVDENFADAQKTLFEKKYEIKDFALSVGRIEPRKNQLNLIKALNNTGINLVLIGNPVPEFSRYYQKCRELAGKNIHFIDRIEHNDPLLASAYAASKVFILQGWFETPGLAALEAGLAGAKLAVTKAGATKEYFADYASYFNPGSAKSIRQAVITALKKPDDSGLAKHIKDHYLWKHSAQATIKAYKTLLKN